jgi:hypothetical protein
VDVFSASNIIFEEKEITKDHILLEKTFQNLSNHKHVRIKANFYFYSKLWNGESAIIKVIYLKWQNNFKVDDKIT